MKLELQAEFIACTYFAPVGTGPVAANSIFAQRLKVTSGGQPVFINCRDTKMNNFTSSAHLAESTFLIYVQINAAWKKII